MEHPPNQDDLLLLIRCPSCGQRFKVGEDLRGRTVECGGCEHRFKIQNEVIVRGRKFYPGERTDSRLHQFPRVPLAVSPAMDSMRYDRAPDMSMVEPTSPQRIIAAIAGGLGIALMASILILGAGRGGILDGVVTMNRAIMAAFVGLLGAFLIVYGNPKTRGKAMMFSLVLAAGLVSLPFFFTEGSNPVVSKTTEPDLSAFEGGKENVPAASTENAKLRQQIGIQPLEDEIKALASGNSSQRALGIWIKDLREHNRLLVRDYIQRVTGVSQSPHFYPRGNGNFLLVISGTTMTLEEISKACDGAFGRVDRIYGDLSVVEVSVDNSVFLSAPLEKLSNSSDKDFYSLNLKELDSIDLSRVSSAVKRLAQAEPKILRPDINAKLLQLLGAGWVDFKPDVCSAIMVWSDNLSQAAEKALVEVKALHAKENQIPKEMVELIVKSRNPGILPIVNELWKQSPTAWEPLYLKLGPLAEDSLIASFPGTDGGLRQSAVRLLGHVGGPRSTVILESAYQSAGSEMKVLIEKALASIRSRTESPKAE